MKIIITKIVDIIWLIDGLDNYGFGNDKKLYNLKRNTEVRQTLNGSTNGYWIGRKFYTLNKLKPLLIRPKYHEVPF